MKNLYKISSFLLVLSLVMLPTAPVFALGEITVESNVPAVTEPAPAPAPVSTPTPEPTPTVSTPSVTETSPTVSNTTAPVIQTITAGDTTSPDITAVLAVSILPTEENIAWTTDELATSHLEYGTTQSYGSTITLSVTAGLAHLAVLTGLTPSTRYYYCIHSTDLAGNVANSCGHEFTTEAQAGSNSGNISNNTEHLVDTTPPNISLVTVGSVNTTGANINLTTSEIANAEVEYGTTAGYGTVSPLDTSLALTHSVTLTGLTPNTEYHYHIRSADEVGNTATSPDNTFTTSPLGTQGEVTTTVPETNINTTLGQTNLSSNVTLLMSGVEASSVSESNVTIVWATDLPTDSQVEYGDSQDLGTVTTLSSSLVTSHSVTISNLSANTNYIFRVISKPTGANVATLSGLHEFTTLSHSTPVVAPANVTSVVSSNITTSASTITWTTDKGATSQVEYALSTSYGGMSSKNSSLSTSHAVALSSLDPATTYHYRVKSVDAVGNETFSDDHTFTTLAPSQNIGSTASSSNNTQISAPDAISTLSIGGYDQSSVELIWHTIGDNADISLKYDVRYSTSPITSDNYANATEAQLTPIYHGDLDPQGTGRTYIVAGLSQNTTYYFAIQSRHQTSDWSAESNVVSTKTTGGTSINTENSTQGGGANITSSGSTSSSGGGSSATSGSYGGGSGGNVGSSFEPTTLKAEPADNQIVFEWNNPGEANFVRTVLMRKEGSYPKSPTDGQTLYEGRGQTFTDTNVTNGKTYYYALYSYNHSKTYSPPVWVSLAPKADNTQIKFNENGSLISFSPTLHFTRVYKRGDKNVEVEHLQEILTLENVSFPEKLITGYFGSYTENSLKQFQKKHGLIQSGIVDASTQAKLNSMSHHEVKLETPGDFIIFDTDQKLGDQGEVVKDLQEFLEYEGSYGGKITGIFDSATKKAVMAFQKKYNIDPVSGYVGYKTRHRMQQLTGF